MTVYVLIKGECNEGGFIEDIFGSQDKAVSKLQKMATENGGTLINDGYYNYRFKNGYEHAYVEKFEVK